MSVLSNQNMTVPDDDENDSDEEDNELNETMGGLYKVSRGTLGVEKIEDTPAGPRKRPPTIGGEG